MLLVVMVALAVPAVTLAGGSAGDQQYTDPFSGGGSHTAGTTPSSPAPSTTTSSPAPQQTTSSAVPSTTPAASTTPGTDPTAAAQPTATIAGPSSTTLPYTGYDAWTAVGFGLTLVAGGATLRWRVRARRS
jgi:hypothetical protein